MNFEKQLNKIQCELEELQRIIHFFEQHQLDPVILLKKHNGLLQERQRLLRECSAEKSPNIPQNNLNSFYETLMTLTKAMSDEVEFEIEISEKFFKRGNHAFPL